jgi:opacity protein-like surface antigen
MFRAFFIALMLALSSPVPAAAAGLNPQQDALLQSFFGELKANRAANAYSALFAGTNTMSKQQEMQILIGQTSSVLSIYGKVTGWEPIRIEETSPSFTQALYLLKTEGVPVFFKFEFYNNGSKWTITRVNFQDNYATLTGKTTP